MSFRSPTSAGLAVAPNAAGDANNPAASPQEVQQTSFWGRFALVTQLPNVGVVDGIAVVGANAASNPAYTKMAPGDWAFVQATNTMYWCKSRGTLGGNDAVWASIATGSPDVRLAVLAADVSNALTNTITDITGLSFDVVAGGTYWFRMVVQYTAALATTGSRWSINGPAFTALRFSTLTANGTTSNVIGNANVAYDEPLTVNSQSASTGSNLAIVEGFVTLSASGTIIGRFASEVAGSAITAKAGSISFNTHASYDFAGICE